VDLRWGIRDDSTDNHVTNLICLREVCATPCRTPLALALLHHPFLAVIQVERCREKSVGPCFLYLSGSKYGLRSPPVLLPQPAFETLRTHAKLELVRTDTPFFAELGYTKPDELLQQWYRLDQNLEPPKYRLVPISHVTGTADPELNGRVFDDARAQLLTLLRDAVEVASAKGEPDATIPPCI
jgi:hypothetical protein